MRPPQDYTLDALRQMIGVSEIYQRNMFDKDLMGMNSHQFIDQFCTVKLMGPRGCGHSTSLIQLVKERFSNWVAIIVPDRDYNNRYLEQRIRQIWGHRHRILVVRGWRPRGTPENPTWQPEHIDAIMIDNASYWDDQQLKRIRIDTIRTAEWHIKKKIPFFYIEVQ